MPELDKVISGLKACLTYPGKCAGDCTNDLCSYRSGDCHTNLLNDALALLEVQRPRVLTLEEVRSRPCFGWIEERENIKIYIALFDFNEMSGLWPCAHVRDNHGNDALLFFESYNKDWRCWDKQPTDNRRKAVKWDV